MRSIIEKSEGASFTSNPVWTNRAILGSAVVVVAIGVIVVIAALGAKLS